MRNGPDYSYNKIRLKKKEKLIDASFLTTDPKSIDFKLSNSIFVKKRKKTITKENPGPARPGPGPGLAQAWLKKVERTPKR